MKFKKIIYNTHADGEKIGTHPIQEIRELELSEKEFSSLNASNRDDLIKYFTMG